MGEAMRRRFSGRAARVVSAVLVIGAILIGNAAYETGNLLGGALGLSALLGGSGRLWGPLLGLAAFALLWSGRYQRAGGLLKIGSGSSSSTAPVTALKK